MAPDKLRFEDLTGERSRWATAAYWLIGIVVFFVLLGIMDEFVFGGHGHFSYFVIGSLFLLGFYATAASAARERGHNGVLWGIIGMMFPVLGLLIAKNLPQR